MKRVVTSEEMQYCDSSTIEYFGVPSLVLMERAALSVVAHMPRHLSSGTAALIVCGNGNNGADGLAIARLLHQQGCTADVVQLPDNGKRSEENKLQRNILHQYGIAVLDDIPDAAHYDCVIDALFGVGLSRPLSRQPAQWIQKLNALAGYKIAVDMPSGVSADTGEAYEPSFDADLTVTFAYRKIGQTLYPGRSKCGTLVIAQIGITDESWRNRRPSRFMLEKADFKRLPQRPARSNKGTFGKALVIAGSTGMAGAALFSAEAAYRTGCGLVKVFTPETNRTVIQGALPEAVLSVYPAVSDKDTAEGFEAEMAVVKEIGRADVIVLGPGIGTGSQARSIVKTVLEHASVPLIIDADGLNILAEEPHLLAMAHAELIVTPHLGEMARLTKMPIPDIQSSLLQTAEQFAGCHNLTCVLKDAVTVTAASDGTTYLNTSGCNAMAKGGSGDVLTGIIAALLAQGMSPAEAASMGVYIHGLAGEAAAKKHGSYSVLARDIIQEIGGILHTPYTDEQ